MDVEAIEERVNKIKKLIEGLEILNSRRDKLVKALPEISKLKGLKDFRVFLFSKEIDTIKQGLQSFNSINLQDLDKIISLLTDIRKDLKYVATNAFMKQFKYVTTRKINEDKGMYEEILTETLNTYSNKLDIIKLVSRFYKEKGSLYPRTVLSLFYASFLISLLEKFVLGNVDRVEIEKIVSEFNYDFILSFSYVESKSHAVHEFIGRKKKLKELITLILELINNPDELNIRYRKIKSWISQRRYPFDIRYPVARTRELFGDRWHSLILIIYREGSIRIIPELTTTIGLVSEPRRIASPLYVEIVVSEDRERLLIISNQSLEEIEKKEKLREAFNNVLSLLFSKDVNLTYLRSLRPKIYDTSSDVFVEDLASALKGISDVEIKAVLQNFENKLKSLMREILDAEKPSKPLTRKEQIRSFVESMKLSEFVMEYRLGKTVFLRLGLELSPFIERILPEVKAGVISNSINSITRTLEELRKYTEESEPIEENVVISFLGKIDEHESTVSFDTKGNIRFHNMNRELVTELSYLLWEVMQRWKKS